MQKNDSCFDDDNPPGENKDIWEEYTSDSGRIYWYNRGSIT
jgi:hypothetical protein